jgi:hypothetical protein
VMQAAGIAGSPEVPVTMRGSARSTVRREKLMVWGIVPVFWHPFARARCESFGTRPAVAWSLPGAMNTRRSATHVFQEAHQVTANRQLR